MSHVNCSLYHCAGNNPIRYLDPDGNQSTPNSQYLPSRETNFNGKCPGMKYDIDEYSNRCKVIGDAVEKAFNAGIESDASIFLNPIISSEEEKRMRQKVEEHIKILQAGGE